MKTLKKYNLLPKKWRLKIYRLFYSILTLPIFSLLFALLFSFTQQGFTQNYHGFQFVKGGQPTMKAYEKAGKRAFNRENYSEAMEHYRNALKIDSTKIENYYQLGLAARAFEANLEAKEAFAMVKTLNDSLNPFPNYKDAIFYYSVIEKELGNEDNADLLKEELTPSYIAPTYKFTKINNISDWNQIENICYDELADVSTEITVTHLDSTVNTLYSEVNPFWRDGKLHYASLRFQKEDDKYRPARIYAKTLHSELGREGDAWDGMNIPNKTTAHFTFNPADDLMYFTVCDYTKGKNSTIQCELYYRVKIDGVWSNHKKVNGTINQSGYTTTHPSIGVNELGEKTLFYVSDRLGGKGGLDIWQVPILGPNKFGEPKCLPINTSKNEITPFYHHDSNTLYFSSEGNKTVKHYDVYKISNDVETAAWSAIEPLPYPINTNVDDFGYFLEPEGKRGFMVSSRADCNEIGDGVWACHDIFQVNYNCAAELLIELADSKTDVALMGGKVTLVGGEEEMMQENLEGNDFRFTNLDTSLNYTIKIEREGYFPFEKAYKIMVCDTIKEPISLEPICQDNNVVIALINSKTGLPINNNSAITIQLGGNATSFSSQNGNQFTFVNIVEDADYQIFIVNDAYLDKDTTILLTPCDTIVMRLMPTSPTERSEYDTIACYFDHDRPRRIGDKPYSGLYSEYLTRFGRYQQRFAGVRGKGNFNTAVCGMQASSILEDSVTTFFCEQVDFSFKLLTRFKDDLLIELATLDKNGDPYIINIKGYTSPVGDTDYNISLADRRIESIKQYFLSIPELNQYFFNKNDEGATNPLLIFENLPFGEDREPPIFEKENDYRNTIYNPHSAIKRRVEIIRRAPDIENGQKTSEE